MTERLINLGQELRVQTVNVYHPKMTFVATSQLHGGQVFGALAVWDDGSLRFSGGIGCDMVIDFGKRKWSRDEILEALALTHERSAAEAYMNSLVDDQFILDLPDV